MRQRALDSISLTTWLICALAGHLIDEIMFRRQQRRTARTYGQA